jgi:hypothetical protein
MNEASGRLKQKLRVLNVETLYKWNITLAIIYVLQAIAIIYGQLLTTAKLFPVGVSYLTLNPIASELTGHNVFSAAAQYSFDVNLLFIVTILFFVSAVIYASSASVFRKYYEADLKKKMNKVRWFQYAFIAGMMMASIAILTGISDLASLVMIFAFEMIMFLIGLVMESNNHANKIPNWPIYVVGCIAGLVPWLVILGYIWGADTYGNGGVPDFVYWICLSIFLVFSGFAVNMFLQYKKHGNWANYLYCERNYMILGLLGQTLLAWQLFLGILHT